MVQYCNCRSVLCPAFFFLFKVSACALNESELIFHILVLKGDSQGWEWNGMPNTMSKKFGTGDGSSDYNK